ncbi:MAG: carbohydrate kinase [Gloeocapsa sp. DLM2.Bin57]|nr:MAG: carbohydrate kinase [Gloeocapsa sp. DLM2.Bin57]
MIYLGLDFGTSGARAIAINEKKEIVAQGSYSWNQPHSSQEWQEALWYLLAELPRDIRKNLQGIAIDGTSATVLLCDRSGTPITPPLMYNDARAVTVLPQLEQIVPPGNLVLSATSSLAKLFWWSQQDLINQASYFLHQADWLAFLLHGVGGVSDYHNALKLGYDVRRLCYPDWLVNLNLFSLLPRVYTPGQAIAPIQESIRKGFAISQTCLVHAGTTDSIAAFLASGASHPGEGVTSLGSTLVLKLLSQTYVENLSSGVYSHRLGNLWLTGGASNTGGAVLKHYFRETELVNLSQQINPRETINLDYYPLLEPGERFPVNNPHLMPKLDPRPDDDQVFLQGLLAGIANIEEQGYRLLEELGATPLTKVYTAGGGAKNTTWQKMRELRLQVPVLVSKHTDAAYGAALLMLYCKEKEEN